MPATTSSTRSSWPDRGSRPRVRPRSAPSRFDGRCTAGHEQAGHVLRGGGSMRSAALCALGALLVLGTLLVVPTGVAGAVASSDYRCVGARAMVPEHHCTNRFARPSQAEISRSRGDGPSAPCKQPTTASVATFCVRGTQHDPRLTVALVGNSHAWRLLPGLTVYAKKHHWQIITALRVN